MLADINVTPFVDILLIVLIAFIISAPLITRSVPIELPQGNLRQENPENQTVTPKMSERSNILGKHDSKIKITPFYI